MIAEDSLDNKKEISKTTSESKWGGKRPGAGRKEGSKNKTTREQLEVKRAFVERVNRHADKLFNAQLSVATGTQMLFMIKTDSKGNRRKPEIVTDIGIISRFLDENEGVDGTLDDDTEYYFMTTARPDNQAIESMLNRSFGKATEKVELDANIAGEVEHGIRDDTLSVQFSEYLKKSTAK